MIKKLMNFPDKVTMRSVETYLDGKEYKKAESENLNLIDQLTLYQRLSEDIMKQLKKNQSEQVKRIYLEFKKNNYGKRFNVELHEVISALIGEDHAYAEIVKMKRDYKDTLNKMKNIKTFNFLDKNNENYKDVKKVGTFKFDELY